MATRKWLVRRTQVRRSGRNDVDVVILVRPKAPTLPTLVLRKWQYSWTMQEPGLATQQDCRGVKPVGGEAYLGMSSQMRRSRHGEIGSPEG